MGAAVLFAFIPIVKMESDKDAVSIMQESVDQLALSMFDSLRLIPFAEEVKGGPAAAQGIHGQPAAAGQGLVGASEPGIKRAVVMDTSWARQVQSLAEGVLKQAKTLDSLIDTLPGAELREDEQMEASVAGCKHGTMGHDIAAVVSALMSLTCRICPHHTMVCRMPNLESRGLWRGVLPFLYSVGSTPRMMSLAHCKFCNFVILHDKQLTQTECVLGRDRHAFCEDRVALFTTA